MDKKVQFVIYGCFVIVLLVSFYGVLTYYREPENYINMIPTIIAIVCLFGCAQYMYWITGIKDLKKDMKDIKKANDDLRNLVSQDIKSRGVPVQEENLERNRVTIS